MRILVLGDRHWHCAELAEQIVNRLLARYGPDLVVIHGGECGVDHAFTTACRWLGVPAEARLLNWGQTGLPTIGTKNRELIKAAPDLCVAIHHSIGASSRTRDCVNQALQAGIPIYLVEDEQGTPHRLKRGDRKSLKIGMILRREAREKEDHLIM